MITWSVMEDWSPRIRSDPLPVAAHGDGLAPVLCVPGITEIPVLGRTGPGVERRNVIPPEYASTAFAALHFITLGHQEEIQQSRRRPQEHGDADERRAANTRQGLHACLL
ncbi:hypothetical protein ebA425 [Aromatoleum aromaticum EbN1]|uniref:Uncharacterized protein n=1 Tax=Aromatoleum aromaticum (strain DSM 19018 / LMG 30748 / EbN1) TaxID=76114 RepID=Q5P8L5_AROAE|nr:hypothetical protein ebA425 [Aromatoleum aromaticum EbN1]